MNLSSQPISHIKIKRLDQYVELSLSERFINFKMNFMITLCLHQDLAFVNISRIKQEEN